MLLQDVKDGLGVINKLHKPIIFGCGESLVRREAEIHIHAP